MVLPGQLGGRVRRRRLLAERPRFALTRVPGAFSLRQGRKAARRPRTASPGSAAPITAPTTATPAAPVRATSAARATVIPPIPTTGTRTAPATRLKTLEPDHRPRIGLRAGGVDRAAADVVRPLRDRLARHPGSSADRPIRNSGGTTARTAATGRSSGPRWTPSASSASATSSRSLTKRSAPFDRVIARSSRPTATSWRALSPLLRSWTDRAPASSAASTTFATPRAPARRWSVITSTRRATASSPAFTALGSRVRRRSPAPSGPRPPLGCAPRGCG